MRTTIVTAAALLFAGAAQAQAQTPPAPTPAPASPSSDLTRDLNSGPPAPAVYLAPPPATVVPATPAPATVVPAPRANPPAPVVSSPPRATPIPVAPPSSPRAAPVTPPTTASPAPATPSPPTPAPAAPAAPEEAAAAPPPSPAPAVTVLDAAARAALPFTADLPPGFEIVTGRPGPDFRIYTIRHGGRSFVMVYAGPASQFPIYSGQMVEAGGRASIVATENGVRRAVEHLFQRSTAPTEIHVWTMSLDGADRAMAEQIAQTIDVR